MWEGVTGSWRLPTGDGKCHLHATAHHVACLICCFAVREALAIVSEEGLESLWARHLAAHNQLWEGLSSMGLQPFVENEQDRFDTVTLRNVLLQTCPNDIDTSHTAKAYVSCILVQTVLANTAHGMWALGHNPRTFPGAHRHHYVCMLEHPYVIQKVLLIQHPGVVPAYGCGPG